MSILVSDSPTSSNNYKGRRRLKDLTHPEYGELSADWYRWRLCYEGGRRFRDRYLEQYKHETTDDFAKRRRMTYVPAFAKSAVNEVRDAVFQRLHDVVRRGGSTSYVQSCDGQEGGVDKRGSSMENFIAATILPELLSMRRVGIWIDNGEIFGEQTLAGSKAKPYLYIYRAEDIINWTYYDRLPGEFSSVLLRDGGFRYDPDYAFPLVRQDLHRWAFINKDGFVEVHFEDEKGLPQPPKILKLKRLPFVMFELRESLLKDIDQYQIALLNLASTDVSWVWRANFPIFIKAHDPKDQSQFLRPPQPEKPQPPRGDPIPNTPPLPKSGQAAQAAQAKNQEVVLGITSAVSYPSTAPPPAFISPSSEPLRASMDKQEVMKSEIRQLLHLNVASQSPTMASAQSKSLDWKSLDNGLAAIGLELERGERRLSESWHEYENRPVPIIRYPKIWSTLSDEQRAANVASLKVSMSTAPSKLARIEILKDMARLLVGHKVPAEVMEAIETEIEGADYPTGDWEAIVQDVENGLVSLATASRARGYSPSEAPAAEADHQRRIERIALAQTSGSSPGGAGDPAARGVKDLSGNPKAGEAERKAAHDPTLKPDNVDTTRGAQNMPTSTG